MIVRLLFFILVFVIGWVIYRQFMKVIGSKRQSPIKRDDKHQNETMVKCAKCGTFVPTSHAVFDHNQNPYCSIEHKQDS